MFTNIKIKHKFALLALFLLAAMAALYLISRETLNKASIGSEAYTGIIMSKDLTADILPPPLYLVETFLEMSDMVNLDNDKQTEESIKTIRENKEAFLTRKDHWRKNFPEGRIKELFLKGVCVTGEAVLAKYEQALLPLIKAKDHAQAVKVLNENIRPLYVAHRDKVRELASLLDELCRQSEIAGVEAVSSGLTFMLVGFLVVVCITMALFWELYA